MRSLFPIPSVAKLMAVAVEAERQLAELRAITGMSQADALHWLTILSAIGSRSVDTPNATWQHFRRAVMAGQSPVEAMAKLAHRISVRG